MIEASIKALAVFIVAVMVRHGIQLLMTRNVRREGYKTDYLESVLLAMCYGIVFVSAFVTLLHEHAGFFYVFGFVVMEVFVVLRLVALRQLGQFFSYEIRIARDHRLITQGIYSYIRHPLHLAFFGEVAGMAIIAHSPVAFIATFILWIVIRRRNLVEDRILRDTFGIEFDRYANAVPSMNIYEGIKRKTGRNACTVDEAEHADIKWGE